MCFKQVPRSEQQWHEIAADFWQLWNFPNCLGALDGKHVKIIPPPSSGSLYFNYKHFFSVIMMALVDAQCRFLYVDVGCYGRFADGGVFNSCSLSSALETDNSLHIPADCKLPGSDIVSPFVIVADDAFAMKRHLVKPYSARNLTHKQRIFNYRLSRARRVVENAFGIMSSRFRIFGKAIPLAPHKVTTLVLAVCCIHNFLFRNKTSSEQYMSENVDQTSDLQSITRTCRTSRHANEATEVRENLCSYFNTAAGAVSWQTQAIMSH